MKRLYLVYKLWRWKWGLPIKSIRLHRNGTISASNFSGSRTVWGVDRLYEYARGRTPQARGDWRMSE